GRVEPGHQDARVAYVAVDAHRAGMYAPLVFRTADLGRTWEPLASDLPPEGPVKVVREDPTNPSLLYAGTEFALFVSLDRGTYWLKSYTGDPVKITVTSAAGVPVAKLSATGVPGVGRLSWDLRPTSDLLTEYGGEGKKFVPAGEYTVTLSYGEAKHEQKLRID